MGEFMRVLFGLVILALSGCGGDEALRMAAAPPLPLIDIEAGRTYAQFTTDVNKIANTTATDRMEVAVNSLSDIDVTFGGKTVALSSNGDGVLSISDDGKVFLEIGKSIAGGPTMENVLLFFLSERVPGNLAYSHRLYMVEGNEAPGIPTIGGATFSGIFKGTAENDTNFSGSAVLTADFVSGTMSGTLSGDAGYTYKFDPVPFSGVGFQAALFEENDPSITGEIQGKIYGADGSEVAGPFVVEGPNFGAGIFTATK